MYPSLKCRATMYLSLTFNRATPLWARAVSQPTWEVWTSVLHSQVRAPPVATLDTADLVLFFHLKGHKSQLKEISWEVTCIQYLEPMFKESDVPPQLHSYFYTYIQLLKNQEATTSKPNLCHHQAHPGCIRKVYSCPHRARCQLSVAVFQHRRTIQRSPASHMCPSNLSGTFCVNMGGIGRGQKARWMDRSQGQAKLQLISPMLANFMSQARVI